MLTPDESAEVVAPFWSDSWKICPTLAFRVACTLRSASAAFVRYCPFGRVPWSTLTVYSPAVSTLTDQRPSAFVVAVSSKPLGPVTSTSTPSAGSRSESVIVPWMHPLSGLTVHAWLVAGAEVALKAGRVTAQSIRKVARNAATSTAARTGRRRAWRRRNRRGCARPGGVMDPTEEPLVRMTRNLWGFCDTRVSNTFPV